jgi:hypothetical protein
MHHTQSGKGLYMFTLGTAARHVNRSKPTISKAINDGKMSAKKVNGVYQIEQSELERVFPARSATETRAAPLSGSSDAVELALATQRNSHLEAAVGDLKARLDEMKDERDQATQDARDDRNRVIALLEDQRPKSLWTRLLSK